MTSQLRCVSYSNNWCGKVSPWVPQWCGCYSVTNCFLIGYKTYSLGENNLAANLARNQWLGSSQIPEINLVVYSAGGNSTKVISKFPCLYQEIIAVLRPRQRSAAWMMANAETQQNSSFYRSEESIRL